MSNSAWCDLNSEGEVLKLHDICPNSKCNCQKQLTPRHLHLEGNGFKSKLMKIFKATEKVWNEVLKSAVNVATPFIGMAIAAKF